MEWYRTELDIGTEFEREEYDTLLDYIDNNITSIIEQMDGDDIALKQSEKYGRAILKYFEKKYLGIKKFRVLYRLGELSGVIRACSHTSYENKRDEYVWSESNKALSKIKNFDKIVEMIYAHENITHQDLSRKLGMKASTLTESMKRIVESNFIDSLRVGRYKVYRLTDYGLRYAVNLKKNRKNVDKEKDRIVAYLIKMGRMDQPKITVEIKWGDIENYRNSDGLLDKKIKKVDFAYDREIWSNNICYCQETSEAINTNFRRSNEWIKQLAVN
ncbi:MarR family winged helix-turn-helix transcriptional regulator [Butyrivibrio sp. INlla16]|uniref:MarR family winged helix-turn-helix transcriptional regulator n=1 Tax=Butyrivibrio sp. INlla16 TaxID=1520807 RepID=UPI0008846B40|nr:MarR family winged helix-turn-helix transcriptional regulator [Butyrivibrio sp. INlla16]SDB68472.1 Winged helix-turn-helix DNA-binding [Butyrivibrio sp. INlla16]